jgi:hypothetical protein
VKIYIGQSRSGQGRRTEAGGEEERWLVKRYVAGGHYFSLSLSLSLSTNQSSSLHHRPCKFLSFKIPISLHSIVVVFVLYQVPCFVSFCVDPFLS